MNMTFDDELRQAAKPGHLSREQTDRATFTTLLIRALEAAAQRTAAADPAQLADAAFSKLHFDFPLVSAEELGSLLERHRAGPGYPLNPKYLAVIREGASAADSSLGSEVPAGAGSISSGGEGSGVGGSIAATASPSTTAATGALVPLFQQLYATVLLKTLQRALTEWDAEACANFLGQLLPSVGLGEGPAEAAGNTTAKGASEEGATWGGLRGGPSNAAEAGEASIPQDTPAQQEDSDDMAYEPLEREQQAAPPLLAHSPALGGSSGGGGPTWRQDSHLLPTLRYLAGQASWHCLCGKGVWRDARLDKELPACLRAACRHDRFPELANGVAQPLLRLVVERVGACPAEAGCFDAVMDALGVAPGDGSSSSGSAVPHPEATRLALSTAAMLAQQLAVAPAPAQRTLWLQVHTRLLPLAAAQLEGVERALAKRTRVAGGGTAVVLPTKEELYCLMAPCQLLYYYVLHGPVGGGARLAEALLDRGLFRALVLLFARLAALQEAESLRCAVLLCCAASPSLLQWAAAVPGFKSAALGLGTEQQQQQDQQQQHRVIGAGEGAAGQEDEEMAVAKQRLVTHGALWQLLLEQGPEAAQPLAALLQAAAASPQQVGRVMGSLQLMAAAQQACRACYPWPTPVEAALRQLSAALKEDSRQARRVAEGTEGVQLRGSCAGEAELAMEGRAVGAAGCSGGAGPANAVAAGEEEQGEGSTDVTEQDTPAAGTAGEQEEKLQRSAGQQAAALAARRAAQLQPAALKLLKDLLQRQGGAAGKHD